MKKNILLFCLVLLAVGCNKSPVTDKTKDNSPTNNKATNETPFMNPTQSNTTTNPDIMAIVQVMDYGYKTTIKINGQDIGWEGPGGGGVRLFNKENSLYSSKATPEILKKNGILKQGLNTITVDYQKTNPNGTDTLIVDLKMQGYSDDLFKLTSTKSFGSVEKIIDIESSQPVNFQPVVVQE